MKITQRTRRWWFLSGGPYTEVLYCSGVDIVDSPIIVTQERWYLCSGGQYSRFPVCKDSAHAVVTLIHFAAN